MGETMSVFGWITEHEGFFSGLVAIAALLGILGAAARLLWVRASDLGSGSRPHGRRWMIAAGSLIAIAAIGFVIFSFPYGESELREVARAGSPTIAVLPFTTMSGDTEHEWLSDGMTEDIITLLARSPAMQVIARNSTFQYKGQSVDIRQVGEELGAHFVVEGSVRPVGDRIRVTVQLIDAESGSHVWADKYDRPTADIFTLQDEVTTKIASSLGDELFKVESIRASQARPENLDAWGKTWRADANWSVEDAREAVSLDESYARAHAVLGRNLSMSLLKSSRDPVAFKEAIREARLGAELAPDDVIVLTHLGVTLLWSGDPKQALVILQRVPSMSPSYAEGFLWYGDALIHNGRPAEGLPLVERALELTPNGRMVAWSGYTNTYRPKR
ncbi:MAG: adenylate cyclase [Gammaproteobacteria bacterium]|jgi:adenylate cyclase